MHMQDRWKDTLGGRHGELPWDPRSFRPDAVVLTVGENDLCCGRMDNKDYVKSFEDAYISFVEYLAKVYDKPQIHFFLAVGPLADYYAGPVRNVVDRLQDAGWSASYLDIMVKDMGDPYGCAYHPSEQMNTRIFQKARGQMVKELGWSSPAIDEDAVADKSGRRLHITR